MQKHIKTKKIKAAEIHPQSTRASLLGLAISSFEFMPHQFRASLWALGVTPDKAFMFMPPILELRS
jgi:hypothetical protein